MRDTRRESTSATNSLVRACVARPRCQSCLFLMARIHRMA